MEPKKYRKGKHQRTDWGHGVKEIRRMKEKEQTPPQQAASLQVQVDDETAKGKYANLAAIAHGENEFIIDFMFAPPGHPQAKVHSRIISSPGHTKRFLNALADNIRRYESRFGPILLREPEQKDAQA